MWVQRALAPALGRKGTSSFMNALVSTRALSTTRAERMKLARQENEAKTEEENFKWAQEADLDKQHPFYLQGKFIKDKDMRFHPYDTVQERKEKQRLQFQEWTKAKLSWLNGAVEMARVKRGGQQYSQEELEEFYSKEQASYDQMKSEEEERMVASGFPPMYLVDQQALLDDIKREEKFEETAMASLDQTSSEADVLKEDNTLKAIEGDIDARVQEVQDAFGLDLDDAEAASNLKSSFNLKIPADMLFNESDSKDQKLEKKKAQANFLWDFIKLSDQDIEEFKSMDGLAQEDVEKLSKKFFDQHQKNVDQASSADIAELIKREFGVHLEQSLQKRLPMNSSAKGEEASDDATPKAEAGDKHGVASADAVPAVLEEERFAAYKEAVEAERKKLGNKAGDKAKNGLSPESTRELMRHMTPGWDKMDKEEQNAMVAKGFQAGDWKLTPGQRQIRNIEEKFRNVKMSLQGEIAQQNESDPVLQVMRDQLDQMHIKFFRQIKALKDTKSASFEELAEYQKELDEVERLQYKLSAKYLEEFGLPLSILGRKQLAKEGYYDAKDLFSVPMEVVEGDMETLHADALARDEQMQKNEGVTLFNRMPVVAHSEHGSVFLRALHVHRLLALQMYLKQVRHRARLRRERQYKDLDLLDLAINNPEHPWMDAFMEDQKQLLRETNRWTQHQKTKYLLMAKEMLTGNEFSQEEIELAQWDDGSARREQELLEQQDLDAEDEVEDESR